MEFQVEMTSGLTNPTLLESAVKELARASSKFSWVGIYLLKDGVLELGPYVGAEPEHRRIEVGKGVCGIAVAEGQDQNIGDVSQVPHYLPCSLSTRSELVVLIRNSAGKIVGQIDIDSDTKNAFGAVEESLVRKVAEELGQLWKE